MKTTVRHLVFQHRIADVLVTDEADKTHRIGHHPSYGWTCVTCDTAKCSAIDEAKLVVIPLEES